MLFGFSIGNVVSFGSSAPSYPTTPSAASPTIVVQPGQTLWGIATQVAPHADPRATVQRIIDLNHLAGTNLQVGESAPLARTSTAPAARHNVESGSLEHAQHVRVAPSRPAWLRDRRAARDTPSGLRSWRKPLRGALLPPNV